MHTEVDGEPLKSNSVDEGEAEVVVAEVEGEPLEPNSVDEGEAGFALVDRVRLALVDRVRLEGLAFYFGDRDFGFVLVDTI